MNDIVCVEIKDGSRRVLYKNKFIVSDKRAMLAFLTIIEKFGGYSIYQLIKDKVRIGDWF